eukprot:12074912-Ditylum_brightwellii.AAC.1
MPDKAEMTIRASYRPELDTTPVLSPFASAYYQSLIGMLRKYHNTEFVFYPSDPVVDELAFEQKDWTSSEFGHVQGKEEVPSNMPEARGTGFVIRAK